MTPEQAAQVLGIAVDASPAEVEHAFQRRARLTHPDSAVRRDPATGNADAGAAFREASEARTVLLRPRPTPPPVVLDGVFADGRPIPRVQGPGLIAVWAGLLVIAALLAIVRADYPLTVAEPVARWAVLVVSTLAYAATGRRVFLVIAIVAVIATVLLTVGFATFGGLLGLLVSLPALLGAFTGGLARERVLRRAVG